MCQSVLWKYLFRCKHCWLKGFEQNCRVMDFAESTRQVKGTLQFYLKLSSHITLCFFDKENELSNSRQLGPGQISTKDHPRPESSAGLSNLQLPEPFIFGNQKPKKH